MRVLCCRKWLGNWSEICRKNCPQKGLAPVFGVAPHFFVEALCPRLWGRARHPQFHPAGTQKRRVTFNSNSPFYLRMWRRGRDLNSRYRFKPVYSLSRRAPSAGSDTSPQHKASHETDQNAEVQASPDRSTCQECSSIGWKLLALPRCFGQGGHRRIDRGRSLA